MLYGCGFRVSEIVNLNKDDLNFQEGLVHIKLGKGNNYMPEASITFYRKTAQTLLDILNGVSFNPVIFNIKFPIIPFVQELSEAR